MTSASKPIPAAALFLLLILSLTSFKLIHCVGNNNSSFCPEIEKEALISFKGSLQDPSNMLSSWNDTHEVNCCEWECVVCSNFTGHVYQLHLQGDDMLIRLHGKISPSLLNLKHLRYLDLSLNDFNETIPSFIGSLTSLEYLNLSRAGFHGTIPHTIGNLSNLHTLSLEGNYEILNADNLEWLSGLSLLEYLNMNLVNLSRASHWVQVINTLPSLAELHFQFCSLDFMVDSLSHVNMTSLAILDLSGPRYLPRESRPSFFIPKWIFQLNNLIFLDLSANYFEGPIPAISNTTKLQRIDLSYNQLNSTIPDWIYICKDLEIVSFISNDLHGAISSAIENLTSLRTLYLSENQLSGKIPREISNLCKLHELELPTNRLSGDISDSFGNMSDCFLRALEYLNLYENQLSGHLTEQFGEFRSLKVVSLRKNSLSGVIPESLGKLSSLQYLNLDGNKLTGNLPECRETF